MTPAQLTEQLLDSKRFCDLLAMAGNFRKRSLTAEDRFMLVQPIVGMILDKAGQVPTVEPRKPVEAPKGARPSLEELAQARSGIRSLGDDTSDLGFDPFKQNDEPEPMAVETDHAKWLQNKLGELPDKGIGERVTFVMDADWNAGRAASYFDYCFKEGGKWALAPDGEGVRVTREGHQITAIRVR